TYTAERTLREQGDKVPSDLKEELDGKIAAVKSALSGSDVEQVNRSAQELSEALQKVGAAVYEQAGATPPPGGEEAGGEEPGAEEPGAEEPGKGDEGTVEGEFREV
ncbi:MAG: molecular chaperone DnaK, partial [Dehalococcoidia bacterium]